MCLTALPLLVGNACANEAEGPEFGSQNPLKKPDTGQLTSAIPVLGHGGGAELGGSQFTQQLSAV